MRSKIAIFFIVALAVAATLLYRAEDSNSKPSISVSKYNHKYEQHRLWDTRGKVRFSPKVVFRIARHAGFNNYEALRMTEIAKGESGWYPGIWGIDPGGTRGYGLWAITPKAWGKISGTKLGRKYKRLGGRTAMLNPVANAKMARFIYVSKGHSAWYGKRYLGTMTFKSVGGKI